MNNTPFKSDFEENPKVPLPKNYFDSDVLLKSIYENVDMSCTWEDTKLLLESGDPDDMEEGMKIIESKKFQEALPYLAEIAIDGSTYAIRELSVKVIKSIGGPEAKRILRKVCPRSARKTVDELVAIALYDDDLAERDSAIRKLMRKKSGAAKDAVEYLSRTNLREMILEIRRDPF